MNWVIKMIDRIFAVGGAIFFAQFPQFFTQYLHQLSGHIGELIYQVNLLENSAKLSGKTLKELALKFLQNQDPDIMRQGDLIQAMMERLETFTTAQLALTQASILIKPFVFIRYVDLSIAKATFNQFSFGLNFTIETLVYGLIGMAMGYSLFRIIGSFFKIFKWKTAEAK